MQTVSILHMDQLCNALIKTISAVLPDIIRMQFQWRCHRTHILSQFFFLKIKFANIFFFLIYRAASSHCTEYLTDTTIILFGGSHYNLDGSGAADNRKTYIFDTVTETWSDGPYQPALSYIQGDYHNMCSSLSNGLVFGGRSGVSTRFTLTPSLTWLEGQLRWQKDQVPFNEMAYQFTTF